MKIRVKLLAFSLLRDVLGREEHLDIEEGSTVAQLLDQLREKHPELAKIEEKTPVIILVNGRREEQSYRLKPGDEVALVPPVSGG